MIYRQFFRRAGVFAVLASMATAAFAAESLLIAPLESTPEKIQKAVSNLGTIKGKDSEGFYRVELKKGMTVANAKSILKKNGIKYAYRSDAGWVDPRNFHSVEEYIHYRRAAAEMNGYDEEAAGVDFYEGLEYYLKPRVDETGQLNHDAYINAVNHRDRMPVARPEWITKGEVSAMTPGVFEEIGPVNLDVPYRTYYGVRSLSGRKNAVAYAPSNPNTLYLASAGGGVWKSTNGGLTWTPKGDNWQFLHCSSVAVHPTNPNIVLVGTGDYVGFFTAQTNGIMKSVDGGNTWTRVGFSDFGGAVVSSIVFVPENPNIILASTGRGNGTGADIWRSTDGGNTWARTNATDSSWDELEVAGTAFLGQNRYIWAVGGSKIAVSKDQGATWTSVTPPSGWSTSLANVGASKNDPDGAIIASSYNGGSVYRTNDGGATWTNITSNLPAGMKAQLTYNMHATVGNNNGSDVYYVGMISVCASKDNGATWVDIARTYESNAKWHNDQHNMTVHPTLSNVGIVCADGGLAKVEYDPVTQTGTFTMLNTTINDTQAYGMSVHPTDHTRIILGTQDNASPASRGNLGAWANLYAGDGGFSGFDGTNPGKHYSTSQGGSVYRYDTDGDTTPTSIGPGNGPFVTPLAMGGTGRQTVFTSANNKLKRNFQGTSGWTDSTTTLNSNARNISVSKRNTNRIFTVHDNGDVWMSTDGGVTLKKIDGNLPNNTIGDIEENPRTDYEAIVGVMNTSSTTGGVYLCTNVNAANPTWTRISGSGATALPAMPVNAVAWDPMDANTIYAATDVGLFISTNKGTSWNNATALGLPNVHINDLVVSDDGRYLYIGTFGRGAWRAQFGLALTSFTIPEHHFSTQTMVINVGFSNVTPAITRIYLTTDNPCLDPKPYVNVPAGKQNVNINVLTKPVTAPTVATMTCSYNGVTLTDSVTVYPMPVITNLELLPNTIYGGQKTIGRVTFKDPLPAPITLRFTETSNSTSVYPTNTTAPIGTKTFDFNVNSSVVTGDGTIQVRCYLGASNEFIFTNLYIKRLPKITNITFTPDTVYGGGQVVGNIILDRPAPPGGSKIALTDNSDYVTVPSSVTVPEGQTSMKFTFNTTAVPYNQNASIKATYATTILSRVLYLRK